MRCPYCGSPNREGVSFCSSCGRDLVPVPPVQTQQTRQPNQQPGRPPTTPPYPYPPSQPSHYPPVQRPVMPQPNPPRPPVSPQPVRAPGANAPSAQPQRVQPARPAATGIITPLTSPIMHAPEPPAPFPPHTIEQLRALESGALAYSVVDENVGNGRKKIVRITYARAVAWQQVATLLKAYREQQDNTFETLIIQGVQVGETNPYRFTNGQLCFDRKTRLGDRLLDRFQIETGSGFEGDAIRIVLSEESK